MSRPCSRTDSEGSRDAVENVLDRLKRWAQRCRFTGTGVIRISFNQGGATSARPVVEQPVTTIEED
jgi:hypothetical protein